MGRTISAALCGIALALCLPAGVAAEQIGVVASVAPDMRGRPPGEAAQVKSPGAPVVANETLSTSASGRGQILFRDQTTLSMSPNSEIVLDGFVFDPAGGGKTGLSLTRGALRFIGGKNSRAQEALIRTPTAIIGVRGSSALISLENNGVRAVLIAGDRLCVGDLCTNRQGGIMTEAGYVGQIGQAELVETIGKIDGPPQRGAGFGTLQAGTAQQDGAENAGQAGLGGLSGGAGGGLGGGTGIADVTGPNSDPVSSRGALRDFQVFDDDARSDAIVGITSSRSDPPLPPAAAEMIEMAPALDLTDPVPDPLPDPVPDPMPDPVPDPGPPPVPDPMPDPEPEPPDSGGGGGSGPPIIIIEPL